MTAPSADPADTDEPDFRLSTPADIVEVVPYLVGFQPENSLVVLSLRGERKRLGLTARVDLPAARSANACAREFVGYLKRDGADFAIVVLYPPSGGRSHPSVRRIAAALTRQLDQARIAVVDVLCVFDGLWWSLHCTDADCCPPDGTPVDRDGTSVAAAVMTVAGQVVLSSRKELERTLDPVRGAVRAAMEYALPRADLELADRVLAGNRVAVTAETIELFRVAVRERVATRAAPGSEDPNVGSIDHAARLIVGLEDVHARDELLTWFDGTWGDATRDVLNDLARRTAPPFEVPTLTLFAWISYLQGNGALAGIALDRALAIEPDYRLAQLLDQALRAPLNPEGLRMLFSTAGGATLAAPEDPL
ncbi:MAG TPA: DUF4192 domain-containing protein [Acidothermaceae bacterium]